MVFKFFVNESIDAIRIFEIIFTLVSVNLSNLAL
jgi:hypothetical protein